MVSARGSPVRVLMRRRTSSFGVVMPMLRGMAEMAAVPVHGAPRIGRSSPRRATRAAFGPGRAIDDDEPWRSSIFAGVGSTGAA